MPSDQSPRVSLLIFAKCTCEAAVDSIEKVLAAPNAKRRPIEEEVHVEELLAAITAAHEKLGVQLEKFQERERWTTT